VSNSGQVVGWTDNGRWENDAFSYTSSGGLVDLAPLVGSPSYAVGGERQLGDRGLGCGGRFLLYALGSSGQNPA
jgi:probable HAF family extracellular repeat protein